MTHKTPHIGEKTYLSGVSLKEAPFTYGDSQLVEAHKSASGTVLIPPKPQTGFLEAIVKLAEGVQQSQAAQTTAKEIQRKLENNILNRIKKFELIPFGFLIPRNLADKPVQIPIDLFSNAEINWNNSELKNQNMEFAGIRLLADLSPVVEGKAEKLEILPFKEKIWADYDLNFMVGEQEAGRLLGISFRTLQGYRVKGGGPEFHKFGKTVKYKIADLINWRDNNRKRNTSE